MSTPGLDSVNRAFSKQSVHFDNDDQNNIILRDLRKQVYQHVYRFLRPGSQILELNAGTGLDALHFISLGHSVHATDLSDGMISQIQKKIDSAQVSTFTVQQLSYHELDKVAGGNYDFIFSNFGGLNCTPNLGDVAVHLPRLVRPKGHVTMVVMPPVCPWELMGMIKGRRKAFRRWNKDGAQAHLEGEYFQTWYHTVSAIKRHLGNDFRLLSSEGLAAISPPPDRKEFAAEYPGAYRFLRFVDGWLRHSFPFNRWADHIILTFQYRKSK